MVVETTDVVDVRGGDEDPIMEEASSMAVEANATEVVENVPVATMGMA